MCGICGIIGQGEFDQSRLVEGMLEALSHRGPDACRIVVDGPVALGHARLSIIDLETGGQPLVGCDGNVICFNGEIYNYKEIRKDLESRWDFRTASDTEVVLAAYSIHGQECLELLNGMFAFCIWDKKRQEVFFARDRMGKKPFYYYHRNGVFAFASEMKGLLSLPMVYDSISINSAGLEDFLAIGYVQNDKTIFSNIKKLLPAHSAVYRLETREWVSREYWDLSAAFHREKNSLSEQQRLRGFRDLLADAVRIRQRADVPLGAFLSGGLDSSAIVALMHENGIGAVNSFTVSFEQADFDESEYSSAVAEHLGVRNTLVKQPAPSFDDLSRLVWHCDEPFCDTSLLPTYSVNAAGRRLVKVALSGDGADEILAGYTTYLADKAYSAYRLVPERVQQALRAASQKWITPSYGKVGLDYKVTQFLKSAGLTPEQAHYSWRELFSTKERELLSEHRDAGGYDPYSHFDDHFSNVRNAGFLDRSLYVDLKTWLPDDILVKADRMSMANSLEVRSPFLDHRIVEYAAMLPECDKMRMGRQKVILRKAMKSTLPKSILTRSKKGFNFPTEVLWRGRESFAYDCDLVSKDFRMNSAKDDVTFKLFALMVLRIWYDMYQQYLKTKRWEPVHYGEV